MKPLTIVSPMFPPMAGGLPDHTDRLASALSAHFDVRVLTSTGVESNRSFRVAAVVDDWHDGPGLLDAIERISSGGSLLWQYVPHMYGRGGVNLTLPRVVRRLHAAHRRQCLLAHEIHAPWSWWPHRSWYACAHRIMWRRLGAAVDAVGVSTQAWIDGGRCRGIAPERLFLAPSPSNLPVAPVPPDHRASWLARHGIGAARRVLGFFGSPGAGKQFDWVLEAWRKLREREPATALVVVGGKAPLTAASAEADWCPALGYLDAPAASAALQTMDVLALPFVDGVSERRSSFMAGLEHGLPIVTRVGTATSAALRESGAFLGVDGDSRDFASAAVRLATTTDLRRDLGLRGREWYRLHCDWPRLARRIAERLE